MQSRVRKDRIERVIELKGGGVSQHKLEFGVVLAGLGDHGNRSIETDNLRCARGDLSR